ncbi:unnamed protein product [Ilex paraguariensis]|uniref:Uncharacterized protein n=1 Tax=Ilex paraguariensis TaxID=185542 RepID=A0ABC8SN14_9AQUA
MMVSLGELHIRGYSNQGDDRSYTFLYLGSYWGESIYVQTSEWWGGGKIEVRVGSVWFWSGKGLGNAFSDEQESVGRAGGYLIRWLLQIAGKFQFSPCGRRARRLL